MFKLILVSAFFSRSCNTMSANIEDKSESIRVPKVCLYILLLNVKNVEDSNFMAEMNSSIEMLVFFLINVHLFKMHSIARSRGMLVNRDTTSNDIKMSVLQIFLPERVLYKLKPFLTCLSLYVKLLEMIFL